MKCTCINEQNIVSGLLSMNLVQCTYNECIFHLQFLKTNKSHTLSHIISIKVENTPSVNKTALKTSLNRLSRSFKFHQH